MDKQRTVNTVTANDEFSSQLMEAYGRWMGGDTFQNSTIKEEIPTGQKQGGGNSGTFVSVNGSLPGVEYDKSTGLPVIDKENTDDGSKKDPKATSNGGEPPTNTAGLKPKYGAQIQQTSIVPANEEKKAAKDYDGDGKVESGKDEYFGSRDKAIKKAMGKKLKKEETETCPKCGGNHSADDCTKTNEEVEAYLWDEAERVLTNLSNFTETTYTVTGEKWDNIEEHHQKDADGNPVPHEDELEEGKKMGLWDRIHAKRKRGESPAKKGDKDYPKTLNVEELNKVLEGMKQARANVGASTCWDGYKAKGTKKKGGKEVPNCVKEDENTDIMDTDEWKDAAKKQTTRIMDMWKKS